MTRLLNGKEMAAQVREEVAAKVGIRKEAGLPQPGLATVLVGEDAASQVYVRSKHKACEEASIQSFGHVLPADIPQAELIELVESLNADEAVHGILVQLPLPKGLDEARVIAAISPRKDVDGLNPTNAGLLAQKGRTQLFTPATPKGIMHMLDVAGVQVEGANAVVLGRSNIVGIPVSGLLLKANATVTICHSRTKDLAAVCRGADILVAAVGQPEIVRGDWVKPGATVIDVGVNRVDDASKKRGYRLVGDVAFDEVEAIAGAITPVPGGVGPMTIAMLLENTLEAAELADA